MDLSELTDAQTLALTGAAEARSYFDGSVWRPAPMDNMIAVMCTPINRVQANPARFGVTVKDACLAHAQYSCWNLGSGTNHDWLMTQAAAVLAGKGIAPIVKMCLDAAEKLLDGDTADTADTVRGATHYYSPKSMVPEGSMPPWAIGKDPVIVIGPHKFYKGV